MINDILDGTLVMIESFDISSSANESLLAAALDGDKEGIRSALLTGATNLNDALVTLSTSGVESGIKALLANGADPNYKRGAPLKASFRHGPNNPITKILLKHGGMDSLKDIMRRYRDSRRDRK